MVGNLMHRKPDNTIIKKTNNGRQPNTKKRRQYNLKKKTNNGRQHHAQKNRQYNYKKEKQWLAP